LPIGEFLEDPGQAIAGGQTRELGVNVLGAADELSAEEVGLDLIEPAQAPAGGGHGFDQLLFDDVLQVELLDHRRGG